jgi:hypothetical protein
MAVPRYGDLDLGAARSLGWRIELMVCSMLRRRLRRWMESSAALLIEED